MHACLPTYITWQNGYIYTYMDTYICMSKICLHTYMHKYMYTYAYIHAHRLKCLTIYISKSIHSYRIYTYDLWEEAAQFCTTW